jgi:succinylarginine dihydrolase
MSEDILKRLRNKVELSTDYYIEEKDIYVSDILDSDDQLFSEEEALLLLYLLEEVEDEECVPEEEIECLFDKDMECIKEMLDNMDCDL